MLKFFRRIRRKLLDEGELRKYITYALGEILLVMIGILLALQVNNWNEQRKSSNLAKSYLKALQEDLGADLDQLRINEGYSNSYEKAGLNVQSFLYGQVSERDTQELNKDFLRLQLFREVSPTKTAYQNLVNSGGINFIKSEKLQRRLANYYREDAFDKRSQEQRARLSNEYDPYRIKYIPSGMLRDFLAWNIFDQPDFTSKNYTIDWEGIRNDEAYRMLLDQILAMRIPALWRIQDTRKQVEELLSEIDQELG